MIILYVESIKSICLHVTNGESCVAWNSTIKVPFMNNLKHQELCRTLRVESVWGDVAYAFISVRIEELCNFILFMELYRYIISRAPSKNGVRRIERCLLKTGA